jgi:hypothetical protein
MTDPPISDNENVQTAATAEGGSTVFSEASPTPLVQRLSQRLSTPPGVINTRQLHINYTHPLTTADRILQRLALPEQVQSRYGSGTLQPFATQERFNRRRVESSGFTDVKLRQTPAPYSATEAIAQRSVLPKSVWRGDDRSNQEFVQDTQVAIAKQEQRSITATPSTTQVARVPEKPLATPTDSASSLPSGLFRISRRATLSAGNTPVSSSSPTEFNPATPAADSPANPGNLADNSQLEASPSTHQDLPLVKAGMPPQPSENTIQAKIQAVVESSPATPAANSPVSPSNPAGNSQLEAPPSDGTSFSLRYHPELPLVKAVVSNQPPESTIQSKSQGQAEFNPAVPATNPPASPGNVADNSQPEAPQSDGTSFPLGYHQDLPLVKAVMPPQPSGSAIQAKTDIADAPTGLMQPASVAVPIQRRYRQRDLLLRQVSPDNSDGLLEKSSVATVIPEAVSQVANTTSSTSAESSVSTPMPQVSAVALTLVQPKPLPSTLQRQQAGETGQNFGAMELHSRFATPQASKSGHSYQNTVTTAFPGISAWTPPSMIWRKSLNEQATNGLHSTEIGNRISNPLPLVINPMNSNPMITRQVVTDTSATVAPELTGNVASTTNTTMAANPSAPASEVDVAQLAEQVSRIIFRKLAIERERRGMGR